LVRGRAFDMSEMTTSMARPPSGPVVLDEMAARRLFGDSDPIGRELLYGNWRATVIGVVANVRMRGPEADSGPQAYFPGPITSSSYGYLVRTTKPPAQLIPDVTAMIKTLRPPNSQPAQVRLVEDAFRNI